MRLSPSGCPTAGGVCTPGYGQNPGPTCIPCPPKHLNTLYYVLVSLTTLVPLLLTLDSFRTAAEDALTPDSGAGAAQQQQQVHSTAGSVGGSRPGSATSSTVPQLPSSQVSSATNQTAGHMQDGTPDRLVTPGNRKGGRRHSRKPACPQSPALDISPSSSNRGSPLGSQQAPTPSKASAVMAGNKTQHGGTCQHKGSCMGDQRGSPSTVAIVLGREESPAERRTGRITRDTADAADQDSESAASADVTRSGPSTEPGAVIEQVHSNSYPEVFECGSIDGPGLGPESHASDLQAPGSTNSSMANLGMQDPQCTSTPVQPCSPNVPSVKPSLDSLIEQQDDQAGSVANQAQECTPSGPIIKIMISYLQVMYCVCQPKLATSSAPL